MPEHSRRTRTTRQRKPPEVIARPRCAVYSFTRNWFVDVMLCTRSVAWYFVRPPNFSATLCRNTYDLPVDSTADFILITSDMAKALYAERELDNFLAWARRVCRGIIGVDTHDGFRLSMAPDLIDRFDLVLKAQGEYIDRDLYNWNVGTFFGGRSWTRREDVGLGYSNDQLDKVRGSLPCFLAIAPAVRDRLRIRPQRLAAVRNALRASAYRLPALYQWIPLRTANGVFFYGSLTHKQRLDALQMFREHQISGRYAITDVPDLFFGAMTYVLSNHDSSSECGLQALDVTQLYNDFADEIPSGAQDAQKVLKTLKGAVVTVSAEELRHVAELVTKEQLEHGPISRTRLHWETWRHRLVFAPTGFGELTFRHGEAFRAGRTLICQDISHVKTLFPFSAGHNVVYCRPDLSDLIETVRWLQTSADATEIARAGKREWEQWIGSVDNILDVGITAHLVGSS